MRTCMGIVIDIAIFNVIIVIIIIYLHSLFKPIAYNLQSTRCSETFKRALIKICSMLNGTRAVLLKFSNKLGLSKSQRL